jgi:hypothetical protein
MRYRTPTFTVLATDEDGYEWECRVKVLTWGDPGRRWGHPDQRYPPEPAEYEVLSVSREDYDGSPVEVHPYPEEFAEENNEEIWEAIHELRQDEQEDYRV